MASKRSVSRQVARFSEALVGCGYAICLPTPRVWDVYRHHQMLRVVTTIPNQKHDKAGRLLLDVSSFFSPDNWKLALEYWQISSKQVGIMTCGEHYIHWSRRRLRFEQVGQEDWYSRFEEGDPSVIVENNAQRQKLEELLGIKMRRVVSAGRFDTWHLDCPIVFVDWMYTELNNLLPIVVARLGEDPHQLVRVARSLGI